ncbi:MAG: hypothetical protein K8823_1592 [Cenarchaeum symbiont of Oopsacas minuta]|nr:hypothetical protein [Cenarchaeum symbiont of Oopsacas minuta]
MSSDLEIKFPTIPYDENHSEEYHKLNTEDWSPFKGYDLAEIFIFAMSYAYANKLPRKPIEGRDKKLPPRGFDTQMRHMMRTLAIHEERNVKIVKDSNKIVKICAEYANAGFSEIYKKIKGSTANRAQILEDMIAEKC